MDAWMQRLFRETTVSFEHTTGTGQEPVFVSIPARLCVAIINVAGLIELNH
jgi:hypothetical protein